MAEDFTVDVNIWIAEADVTDLFHEESSQFLAAVGVDGARLHAPAFAGVEVACALARKYQNSAEGRRLANDVFQRYAVTRMAVDEALLGAAEQIGTDMFLRGANAVYVATAQLTDSTLVSWDNELIQRAGAISPTTWLDAVA